MPMTPQQVAGYLRVTVLPCPAPSSSRLVAVVLLSPPGDLRGLTRRELEILGLLVAGWSNRAIANALFDSSAVFAARAAGGIVASRLLCSQAMPFEHEVLELLARDLQNAGEVRAWNG